MGEKIKILQLAPRFPYPKDDGGKIGIANIFQQFSQQNCDVTLFAYDDNNASPAQIAEAEKYGRVILHKHSIKNTPSRIFLSLFRKKPIFTFKYYNRMAWKSLENLVKENHFDIIHADHSSMMPLAIHLSRLNNIRTGLRLHNIEWMIWQRYADSLTVNSPKKAYIQHQANLLREEEKRLYKKADVCFAITEPDRQRAISLSPTANVTVASAGVDPAEWSPDYGAGKNPYELILATTYTWVHNVNAVRWFIENVLPLVRNKFPNAYLTLIGKNPPEWLNDYKEHGVNLVGYLPKVQPYLNRASVYVAPLVVGGGIRIKILEAMAISLPVIATSISAEGITATRKNGLITADDEVSFANEICSLLSDHELALSTGRKAREFIINEYSWEKNVNIMIENYKQLLKKDI